MDNQLILKAAIAELQPLRYTPAGLPALDLRLEHASVQEEAGERRQVRLTARAIAFGALAERLARQAIGSTWALRGFIAAGRNGKGLVFHIQEIQQD
ncbi:primosomal replication protein N [Melaminivora alkalimesophila]|uniref:Replication restart protein PriB n=1 Tax=Melaminivora alkalimesophila TaxID=1165852 RepID=A0A317RAB7_9BURK|nr:primosomal replication protein N [Melaminivora alkalimesophila]PWW45937.1 restart primosome assembly protein PriB [Melaminivora alkalimesophila]